MSLGRARCSAGPGAAGRCRLAASREKGMSAERDRRRAAAAAVLTAGAAEVAAVEVAAAVAAAAAAAGRPGRPWWQAKSGIGQANKAGNGTQIGVTWTSNGRRAGRDADRRRRRWRMDLTWTCWYLSLESLRNGRSAAKGRAAARMCWDPLARRRRRAGSQIGKLAGPGGASVVCT